MVGVSEASYWKSVGTLTELAEVGAARTSVQNLAQSMLDAETGQRGYLLTNRKEYLQPYEKALKEVATSFQFLDQYYSRDPNSTAILTKLHNLSDAKLSELAETMRLFDEGKLEAATQLVLSDIGKEKMEAMRQLTAELIARETSNVAVGRSDIDQTLWLSRIGVTVLSALSLLALFMYLRQTSALGLQREEQRRQVQVERDRLEKEVSQRTVQLTELTDHLQTAREDERHRLARNLHDELGALLTSAKLDAARIRSRLTGTAPEALERLAHLVDTLNSSIALGRRIIEDLRPSTLSNLGLVATLEILARDFSTNSGITVHCDLEPVKLPTDAELVVYRLVQESITNITKYARAKDVWIGLKPRGGQVEITVRDDGVGFDTTVQPRSAYGLVGMRYRVEAEGGALQLVSAPGQGTQIRVTLPESAA
ncbi:MAG: CHASE3 domain-containing protein [Cytophagales bacterium]|nr:CHASE3 domain-containing protein [Rhizobacter sp.]